jgi:hypothetical protein
MCTDGPYIASSVIYCCNILVLVLLTDSILVYKTNLLMDFIHRPVSSIEHDVSETYKALNRRPRLPQPGNKSHLVAFLPFVGTLFNRISRVLARHNIKSVGLPHMKLSSLFRPVKDHLGSRHLGFTGSSVSAAESTLGRRAVPWTSG